LQLLACLLQDFAPTKTAKDAWPTDYSKALNNLKDASGVCVISFKEFMDVSLRLGWWEIG